MLYDAKGSIVDILYEGECNNFHNEYEFNLKNYNSGIYFIKLDFIPAL